MRPEFRLQSLGRHRLISFFPRTSHRRSLSLFVRHDDKICCFCLEKNNQRPAPTFSLPSRKCLTKQQTRFYSSAEDSPEHRPAEGSQMELDFFGEPVTFLGMTAEDKTDNAMATLDGFLLASVSKGKSCIGGGMEAGLEVKSAHAAAVAWAEILRHATVWNHPENKNKSAPMLAVTAVAPVLAQAGFAYVKHLDTLLSKAKAGVPGLKTVQMISICEAALQNQEEERLNPRERLHLQALAHMLSDEHPTALVTLLKLLRMCPGDMLALSLAMDLAHTVGDKGGALRAAGSVASYWNERRGGFITPALPGYPMASSLVALGFAVGGRHEEAELMAERAMNQGKKVCGGLATWAQAHIFDAGGRVSEGISALANFDGIRNYEGSGLLFFDCRLGGYGARFSLDREERGRGKSAALRLYEANFERVLGYSGFAKAQPWREPLRRSPLSWSERTAIDGGSSADADSGHSGIGSFFLNMLGKKKNSKSKEEEEEEELKQEDYDYEILVSEDHAPSHNVDGWEPSCEDVLTWIPPTPQLLSDATLLLLRFTLNGTISARNARWDNVRNAWISMFELQKKHCNGAPLKFCPLARVVASILFPPADTGGDQVGGGRLALGLYKMGELLQLGNVTSEEERSTAVRELIAERHPSFWLPVDDESSQEWKEIVDHLVSAIDGIDNNDEDGGIVDPTLRFDAWDFEARPILEHAIVYAACKSGDTESLCLARSISSQGVSLRPNSPEEWWRYSIILGVLGDQVGSEDALQNSINVGAGQGARS